MSILLYVFLLLSSLISVCYPELSVVTNGTTTVSSTTVEHNINELLESTGKPWWYQEAIKDVAYYMRSYKFNEYDRRYELNANLALREYYKAFPRPPLRSLHWEVHRYCETSFLECMDYLRKKLKLTYLRRTDDTSIVIQEQKWSAFSNQTIQVEEECKKMRRKDDLIAKPFEGPLERFQWRISASYFLCWYTMNEVPDLAHLDENCDNFAYCLDQIFGSNNRDPRANDQVPFACALYSFCPDPCCPAKHTKQIENCRESTDNPCYNINRNGNHQCQLLRHENSELKDIILNRWNVTCICPEKGYVWSALYGICIDIDECALGTHNCQNSSQDCVNLKGSFRCICKWGYYFDSQKNVCIASEAINKLRSDESDEAEGKNKSTNKGLGYAYERFKALVFGRSYAEINSLNICLRVLLVFIFLCILIY